MKQEILDELTWTMDDLVAEEMEKDRYANEDLVRERVAREFVEWLVGKFKEECGYNES